MNGNTGKYHKSSDLNHSRVLLGTFFFKGDANMEGNYFGYDGSCPPWNDERIYKYHFSLYALDIEHLDLPDPFGGPDVLKAIEGHIITSTKITGIYTLNKILV